MSDSDGLDSTKYRSSRRQPQTLTQHPDPSVKCPRCESSNTKFCYYNNYNKTQPRHFCKACKRYWTKGGTLRNVPVGGGRKNKRLRCPNTATIDSPHTHLILGGLSSSTSDDVGKAESFIFKQPISGSEKSDHDVESYTDIEELKGLVSWDFYGSFIGCTMQEYHHPRLGFSKISSSFETNPSSNAMESDLEITTSMIMPTSDKQWQIPITSNLLELNNRNWNELDTMVLEDLNKPWEDPTFKT